MTKSELIETLAERANISKGRADTVVTTIFDAMTAAMERNEGIEVRGFGTFTVRTYEGYKGRNPRTGTPVEVSTKRLPFFKVGKELREVLNHNVSASATSSSSQTTSSPEPIEDLV